MFMETGSYAFSQSKHRATAETQATKLNLTQLIFKLFYFQKITVTVSFKLLQILYIKELILMVTKKC